MKSKSKKHIHFRCIGRELAMQFLFQLDLNEDTFNDTDFVRFLNQLEASGKFEENKNNAKAKKYARKLIEGIMDSLGELDEKIQEFLSKDWDWGRIPFVDRSILRLASYEMYYAENVPPVVAINEGVELAKKYSTDKSKSFINALLNNIKNSLDRDPRIVK